MVVFSEYEVNFIAFIIMEAEDASEKTMSDIVEVVYNMDLKQMTIPNYY